MYNIIRGLNKFVRLGTTNPTSHTSSSLITSSRNFCAQSSSPPADEESPAQPNVAAIANGDKDVEHKLKVLILEVDVMRQEGRAVPDAHYIKDHHWQELLKLPTISARRRYAEFLFKTSKKKENRLLKQQEKTRQWEEVRKPTLQTNEDETFEEFAQKYDLRHNNIFLRFYDSTINEMYNNRLIQAIQFGQKLVVDCGYDEKMTNRENVNCAKQIMLLFSENRFHDEPYDLHLCNINPESSLIQSLHRHIPPMYEKWFPINVHESSYLDVFPKEQLVYLTPHCREELVNYSHDDIYIIGGIVDKMNQEPLSLAKAKKEGLRMAKLPLDRYLQWGSGSGKNLTLNQVASIMLDVKQTGDWKHSLRHVPRRKLTDFSQTGISGSFASRRPDQKTSSTWRPKGPDDSNNNNRRLVRINQLLEE